MKTLADRVRWARTTAGLGATELDRVAGLVKGHVSMIEGGHRDNLTSETATKLSRALGLTLDWLVNGDGAAPSVRAVRAAVAAREAKAAS